MTPAISEGSDISYETIDVNIVPDAYVTWIVDLWKGKKNDPATEVKRYIGVWRAEQLETEEGEALDPVFKNDRYYGLDHAKSITPQPMVWVPMETVKAADRDAEKFREQSESAMDTSYMGYGSVATRKQKYIAFMDAIDVLATDPENKDAWTAVDAFRQHQALEHER